MAPPAEIQESVGFLHQIRKFERRLALDQIAIAHL